MPLFRRVPRSAVWLGSSVTHTRHSRQPAGVRQLAASTLPTWPGLKPPGCRACPVTKSTTLGSERYRRPAVDGTLVNALGPISGRTSRPLVVWAALLASLIAAALGGCQAGPEPSTATSPRPTATPPPASAEEALASFYNWYTAYPGDPLQEGRYRSNQILSPYLTDEVIDKVETMLASFGSPGGYDPFLCAQDVRGELSFETIDSDQDSAQIAVRRRVDDVLTPTGMMVDMVRRQNRWQLLDVTCYTFSTEDAAATTELSDSGSAFYNTWAAYHSQDYGFRIRYPSGWQPSPEIPTDTRGEDPIAAYIVFQMDGAPTPVALVISTGTMDSFRLLFPTPVAGGQEFTSGSNTVLYEQHFGGEQYYVIPHPLRDDLRVALRVVDRSGTAGPELDEIVNRMLESFSYDDVSSVERGARP